MKTDKSNRIPVGIALAAAALILAGCSRTEQTTAGSESEAAEKKAGSEAVAPAGNVKAYPLEVCVVSDEKLGSMGKPHVITYEGREIKFCCDGCEEDFRKEPAKFLAKIDALAAEKKPAP